MTLLIIGGTGTLGRQITRRALQEGYQVRCLVRSVRQAAFLKEWGAQLVYGDLSLPETIPPCLYGISGIIDASTARAFDDNSSYKVDLVGKQKLIEAASLAKVDRFIFFSLVNLNAYDNVPLLRYKKTVESSIKNSGVSYTIFRLSGFYQGLISQYCVPILDQQPIWITTESTTIAYMDTQDISRFVVQSLSMPKLENQLVNLTGNHGWTSREVVQLCTTLSGKKAKVNRVPLFALRLIRQFMQMFEWTYNIADRLAFAEVLASGNNFQAPMEETYRLFNVKSEEMISLEKYLKEYFSTILKKLKELNYDQKQKRKDIVF
uniref:hypothetical protein n=1 Tax=Timspurckia oligopyrenoides TaxID=708627 RepID=UPI001FCD1063|nr:hypothetical protein MW591_pgp002 [Timspurckia oligopyrenoides]UNJ17613.1 hypothetical protein [Timspurckia oligopyrenoides]